MPPKRAVSKRAYCFTLNADDAGDLPEKPFDFDDATMDYLVYQKERGGTFVEHSTKSLSSYFRRKFLIFVRRKRTFAFSRICAVQGEGGFCYVEASIFYSNSLGVHQRYAQASYALL